MRRLASLTTCVALGFACSYPRPADVGPASDAAHDGTAQDDATPGSDALDAGTPGPADMTQFRLLANRDAFAFHDLAGRIDNTSITVSGFGVTRTASFVAAFKTAPGATVTVGGAIQRSGLTSQTFGQPVHYVVTSQDGTMFRNYTVTLVKLGFRVDDAGPSGHAGQNAVAIGALDGSDLGFVVSSTGSGAVATYRTTPSFMALDAVESVANPTDVALADLNQDGKLDLIVAHTGSGAGVSAFLNSSSNSVTFDQPLHIITCSSTAGLAVGDLDGIGGPDVAVANPGQSAATILFNATVPGGSLSLGSATSVDASSSPFALAITDVDRTGLPDLAVASFTGNVTLLSNQSTGAPVFAPDSFQGVGAPARLVLAADLDGDHHDEIAVLTTGSADSIQIVRPGASGSVSAGAPNKALAMASADFDGDGIRDLVAVTFVAGTAVNTLQLLVATGSGDALPFGVPEGTSLGSASFQTLAAGDVDGDGLADIVLVFGDGVGHLKLAHVVPVSD